MSADDLQRPSPELAETIRAFVTDGVDAAPTQEATSDPFWGGLREVGTRPWLDTGDIEAASRLWVSEFSALTTNNTLLNAEVQKGIYDGLIAESARLLDELDPPTRVVEIAFILNARHGLNLVKRFGANVSVELHTVLAHDVEATLAYARRFQAICPDRFIVKIPLTAAGLLATRRAREEGIPVNFTLGFSARQNYLATALAAPSYVNVFLGRLNSYVADNELGDGNYVGEKATLASQRHVTRLSAARTEPTLQIAASMRGASQVRDLAGVDVFTMPTKVAEAARAELTGKWESRLDTEFEISLTSDAARHVEKLWEVSETERELFDQLSSSAPDSPQALLSRCHDAGVRDLFPKLDPKTDAGIASGPKIPVHREWSSQINDGELAIDSALNLAALATFSKDQAALDERIRGLI